MTIAKWNFSASLGDTRLRAMTDPPPFQAIVDLIHKDMKILCCHPEPCDIAHGFERIIYCVKIDKELFDLFFNSRAGYRAAYYESPFDGLRANAEAIGTLAPTLISYNAATHQRPRAFIEESLSSPSAKVWLAEPERGFCPACAGEWAKPKDDVAEISNGRWERDPNTNATWGRKAPYFTKLRIFGAFLNAKYDEVIPGNKRHRARHLYQRKWA